MTDDIKAIRDALAAGPTPGPWQDDADGVHRVHAGRHRVILGINISDAQRETDAAYVAACHPERIARLLDALEQAQRREEVLRFERDIARARAERTAKLLGGVHALAYPPRVQTEGGRAFEFRPPDPYKFMQELSDRIRAIPDELAAIDAAMSDAPGA